MIKTLLFASAATLAVASPALAQDGTGTIDASLTFNNNIDTSIVTDVTYTKNVGLFGNVNISGDIEVDSSAVAVSDHKQIIDGNMVIFDEAVVDEDDDGLDDDDESVASNRAGAVDVDADGNVGVNSAAGQYNAQANVATIAVASGGDGPGNGNGNDDDDGGWAEANTTGAQSLTNTYYGPEFDDAGDDPYTDENVAVVGDVGGDGNIGVNSAAGAFNSQANIMTMAVADDSSLAEATAGVVQFSAANMVIVNDTSNRTNIGTVSGAGNIAVNAAAGVGNMQHNSLTVAASGAFGGNGTGGNGNGGL